MPVLPCITYAGRKITVIDGQPFYESSGHSSGMPGTWLPFIMVLENFKILTDPDTSYQSIQVPPALYGPYIRRRMLENQDGNIEDDTSTIGYFLLYNGDVMHPTTPHRISARKLEDLHEGLSRYLSLKNHAITSIRLGGGVWQNIEPMQLKKRLKLDDEAWLLIQEPYTLPEEPYTEVLSPSDVNAWLLAQGAEDIAYVFCSDGMAENAADYFTYRLDLFIDNIENRSPEPSSSKLGLFSQNSVQVLQEKIIAELKCYYGAIKSWIKQEIQKNNENAHQDILTALQKSRLIDDVTQNAPEPTEAGLKTLQERLEKLYALVPTVEELIARKDDSNTENLSQYRAELILSIDLMGIEAQGRMPASETALNTLLELHIDAHYAETQRDLDTIRMQLLQLVKAPSFLAKYNNDIPNFLDICARKFNKPRAQSSGF